MVKKITAPKSYDPGKGRPREHLAYLNEREMAYLRQINGNNMERGPRGLPSFPPDDALGSSSKAGGTTSTKSSTSQSTSSGTRGAGSNYGPGSGKPGTSSATGGGNKGSVGSSPSTAAGGQRGAGSNYGAGSGRPGTTSTTKGPSSPMGGQGTSFSSPSKAASYNNDQAAQQRAAVKDTVGAVKSNSALKGDLQVGGIRTLNVGPMGTPVSVGKAIAPSVSSYQGVINKGAISSSIAKSAVPQGMYGPRSGIGVGSYMTAASQPGFITSGMPSAPSGMPPAKTRGLPSPDVPLALREYSPYDIRGAEQPYGTERVMAVENVPNPNETIVGKASAPQTPVQSSSLSPSGKPRAGTITTRRNVETTYTPGDYAAYREGLDSFSVADDGIPRDENGNVIGPETTRSAEEAWKETPYGEPGVQAREKSKAEKVLRNVPGWIGGITRIGGYIADKRVEGMTPDERIAEMDRYAQMNRDRIKGAGVDNDRGPYRRFEPTKVQESTVGTGRVSKASSGRPQAYYDWDAGVNIPSPGDSDYTLYLKYLEEKAASEGAVS